MKIALAQINTTIGDFEGIIRKVSEIVARAQAQDVELVVFPEMTTTGYPPRDLLEISGFVEKNLKALDSIARLSTKNISLIVGYIDRNTQSGAKALFNAAALCENGHVTQRYYKNLLPTYDVFDEGRYFEPGTKSGLWKVQGRNIGISICEDAWNDKIFWKKTLYARDPIEEQVRQGSEILINISASPFSIGKQIKKKKMLQALAKKHSKSLFYVNFVGGNDELVFDGRSSVVNAQGDSVVQGKAYEEDLLIVDSENLPKSNVPEENDADPASVYGALVLGVKDYVRKCGFKKVVLGLSGGIDSALTAVIAADALGAENVLGVAMPSPYSSAGSVEDARALAKNLKIGFEEIRIDSVYESYRHLFGRTGEPDLADENVQARIRGNILMTLSNRYGSLVLTTGNKSELAVGYCTLYGDMSGGLAVISDLPKTLVYEVARWRQSQKAVIPEETFTKPPSAELRPNQTDQDSLPPYEILDPILKAAVEEAKSQDEVVSLGFDPSIVDRIFSLIKKNEYKRHQAAPGIKVSEKAFGMGRRYPIARKI